jgi:hypothetical protein
MHDRHKHLGMHNSCKCLGFDTMHLHFTQYLGHTTHRIHITLKRLRFQRTCKTLKTLKICKQMASNLERKLEYVSKKN